MYLDYFGLKEAPFRITPNTEYWYAGGQRGEILAALLYAIAHGEGIIKVVGEVGSGKTMLCRKLAAQLPDDVDSVYLGNPSLDPDDMLAAILADLGETTASGRHARLAQLNAVLLARHEAGRRVVVFVEEAQGIALDKLEFLRLLTNLETATDKLLQIVLFGQPELDTQLADPRIRQLRDRITLSLYLSPLNEGEVGDYLRARLAVAGYRGPDLFSEALIARLTRLSAGLSRRINVLADKTLLAAYAAQTHTLTLAHLDAAAGDAELPQTQRTAPRRMTNRRWAWLGVGAVALGLLAWAAWQARPQPSAAIPAAAAVPEPAVSHAVRVLDEARLTRQWLAAAAPGTHVIQVAAAKDAAQAAVLLAGLDPNTPRPVRVFYGRSRGAPAWMILVGEFPDRDAATTALRQLPATTPGVEALRDAPFLRTVRKMRAVALPTG
ncbi:ATPase, Type II secretory pathway component [Thiobacillus denitrificans ATCC 25259]|uniref:ATPase, Type II secretory pathway component n=1 Tax=Thiobacillus denitrificans (strain ATCC 25259 / T1) TaxID=292415 RepID=Q3SLB2_THIDA|nr:AAA family ATPase [Thiobacillus denitrificans]AAZ96503.1 ATPase, Type II secretory pathway component [Thiobacillus denitrificans ATCC 25259]